ncbi:MAG: hypothetical protein U0166_21270 [Acidobacteriota bacterium]
MSRAGSILDGWRFAALVATIVAATSAPAISWWLRTPPGQVGLGGDFVSLGDFLTYVSWLKQAEQGHLLFLNLYDPVPQERTLFLPFFLVLGTLARVTGAPAMLALHLARAAASVLLFLTARGFVRAMLPEDGARVRAFLMLALGTGLPALVPEASPVSAMFDSALHAFSWCLFLVAARAWLAGPARTRGGQAPALRGGGVDRHATGGEQGGGRAPALQSASAAGAAIAGICASALLFVHPYDAVTLTTIVAATSIDAMARRTRGSFGRFATFGLCAAPAAAHVAWTVARSPALRTWAMFPRRTSGWELLSFGTIAVLALLAALAPRRDLDRALLIWIAAELALVLLPLPSQRRYILGLQAPLAILAARGFDALIARGLRRTAKYLLACAFPVSVLMLLIDATNLTRSARFVDAGLVAEIRELEKLPPGVIFARPYLGQLIAPFAGRQVFAGHPGQTPDIAGKTRVWEDFAAGKVSDAELASLGMRWIVVEEPPEGPGPRLQIRDAERR